jgi:PAS domain S-box-containing protein
MQSEKQFKKIIQNLTDAIYVCDASGYLKLFNQAAAELWGRQPEIDKDLYCGAFKIIGKDGFEMPPENHPLAVAMRENKTMDNVELIIKRPDGSYRSLLHSCTHVFNMNGEFAGAINMLTDVTKSK